MSSIRRLPVLVAAATFTMAMLTSSATGGTVIHVDDDAPAAGDGLTWSTAYRFLQDALANVGAATEIRVAQGLYKPDEDEGGNVVAGDRSAAFSLVNGVALRGGYAGIGAPNPDERDLALHETILSGDLLGNDAPNFVNNGENSYHVVLGNGTNSTATLDGFTVSGGNANGTNPDDRGGGMLNNGSSPTVTNCTFSANTGGVGGTAGGGGMANVQFSSPIVTNCTFSGNGISNSPGGGMYNKDNSSPTVSGCTFSNNLASSAGGMYNRDNSSPTVTDCTFIGNNTSLIAGAMNNEGNSNPTVTGCTFSANTSGNFGGGGISNSSSSPTVINCSFDGNTGGNRGGGIFNSMGTPTIINCSFINNAAVSGGAIYTQDGGSVVVSDSSFSNNTGTSGGALFVNGSSATVTNCRFSGNIANSGVFAAGGAIVLDGILEMTNCTLIGNMASGNFGEGGGLYTRGGTATVVNCTFRGNTSVFAGGGIYVADFPSTLALSNSILWGNSSAGSGDEIVDNPSATTTIRFSDIQGSGGSGGGWDVTMGNDGGGNIDADPLFAGADGRLSAGSPSIDAGHNWAMTNDGSDLDGDGDTTELTPLDLDDNPRFADDPATVDTGAGTPVIVDMGAYEFPGAAASCLIRGDANGDGAVNVLDLVDLLLCFGDVAVPPSPCSLADFNADGTVNVLDLVQLLVAFGTTCS